MIDLALSNKEIRNKAADRLEQFGKADGNYHNRDTGACCILGAVRLMIFGRVDIWAYPAPTDRMRRYEEITEEIDAELPMDFMPNFYSLVRIGRFNDSNDQATVVALLRGKD